MKGIYKTLLFIPLVLITAHPSGAEQAIEGDFTLGGDLTWLTRESYKYGEYDGLHADSKHAIVDVELSYEKEPYYMEFKALDLGYHDETVILEGGRYGRYSLQVGYTKLIHFISEGKTPLIGVESDSLTLLGGFGRHTTTSSMVSGAGIPSYDIDLDTKRKDDFITYKQHLSEKISFSLDYRHGEKEGIRSMGGVAGADGALSASIILPERVDYISDAFNAGISYKGEKGTVQLDYMISNFHNRHDAIRWDNPFAAPSGDAYPDTAQTSLPPDNRSQKISLTATAMVTEKIWLSIMAGYDRMEQDESLLPYTINTSSYVPLPRPRDSAEAKINVSHLTLKVASRPTPSLSINANYRHYDSKNETPMDLFLKVLNDTGDQVAADDEGAVYSLPRDYRQDKIGLDARYRLSGGTKISLGFDHDVTSRDYRAAKGTKESTFKAGVSRRLPRQGRLKFDYTYADRQINGDYDASLLYNDYHSSASGFYNYTAGIFDENELLRQFDIAERLKQSYALSFSLMAFSHTMVGLNCRYIDDDYKNSELGLKEREDRSCTIDMTATPGKDALFFTYYTNDRIDTSQVNRSFTSSLSDLSQKYDGATDSRRNWWADSKDLNHTVGLGTTINFLGGVLIFDANYVYTTSRTSVDFRVGSDSTIGFPNSLPDLKTRRDSFNMTGRYNVNKKVSLGVEYYFEKYQSDDWATDGIEPASSEIDELLTLTGSHADYEAHGIKLFLTYSL